eukprot:6206364-Pleurochrysis_carterae.AAC.3
MNSQKGHAGRRGQKTGLDGERSVEEDHFKGEREPKTRSGEGREGEDEAVRNEERVLIVRDQQRRAHLLELGVERGGQLGIVHRKGVLGLVKVALRKERVEGNAFSLRDGHPGSVRNEGAGRGAFEPWRRVRASVIFLALMRMGSFAL